MTPEQLVDDWPRGASEAAVRSCAIMGCDHCTMRVQLLDAARQDVALDGEHQSITSYAR